jgi:hypothetical protein
VKGEVLGTKTYSDVVYVGNSFTWYVEKFNVSSETKPEAETVLEEGDELKFTIINYPEVNYSEVEEAILGITGSKYVSITQNGEEFDRVDAFLVMPYIFIDAIVIPVSSQEVEAQGCTNTMEMMQDMFDEPSEGYTVINNEIIESYYEIEYTFEIAPMSGYIRRKYDIETGIVLLSHEDIDIYEFDNPEKLIASSDILLVNEDERTTTTTSSIIPLFLSILIPSFAMIRKRRKKQFRS